MSSYVYFMTSRTWKTIFQRCATIFFFFFFFFSRCYKSYCIIVGVSFFCFFLRRWCRYVIGSLGNCYVMPPRFDKSCRVVGVWWLLFVFTTKNKSKHSCCKYNYNKQNMPILPECLCRAGSSFPSRTPRASVSARGFSPVPRSRLKCTVPVCGTWGKEWRWRADPWRTDWASRCGLGACRWVLRGCRPFGSRLCPIRTGMWTRSLAESFEGYILWYFGLMRYRYYYIECSAVKYLPVQ